MQRAGALLATASLALAGAPVAAAADTPSGLWYYDMGHIQDAHDAGFTGEGVTIAVLDTQINPDAPTLRNANLEVVDKAYCFDESGQPMSPVSTDYAAASHGTSVAALIAGTGESTTSASSTKGVAPGAKVRYSAVGSVAADSREATCLNESGEDRGPFGSGDALRDAIDAGVDIISVSYSGFQDVDASDQLVRALALGIVVIGGLPNDMEAVGWPAAANGVVAVQAFGSDGRIQTHPGPTGEELPNVTEFVEVAAPGVGILTPGSPESWEVDSLASGTSLATPIVAGFLAVTKSRYPDATGNQLIQSLIHNTGGEVDGELQWGDDMGYGAVSLTAMLQVDPGKYPDVNPLLKDGPWTPSVEEVEQARKTLADASASAQPSAGPVAPADPGGPGWLPWAIGGGVVGLLVIAGVVILVVVVTRSSTRDPHAQGGDTGNGQV